ncbi:MAG: lipoyl synthase [Armatimonadota bacterium]
MRDRPTRLPEWLRVKIGKQDDAAATTKLLRDHDLCTVCEQARCPNIGECFRHKTATFMLLGDTCTRNCRFCAIDHASDDQTLPPPDPDEPRRIAEASADMGMKYIVVTSVTRDDLPDGGAEHFAKTIRRLKETIPDVGVEVLTPDFQGNVASLSTVLQAGPTVFNHNVETVRTMAQRLRPQADYDRSMQVLRNAKEKFPGIVTKSGFMVGVGETDDEIKQLLDDLAAARCEIVTIGQYLQPTRQHHPVDRYVPPERFDVYAQWARRAGIPHVSSGPFVRSSYRAASLARAAIAER